uniref:START domain-containing protein n=1 Tax=Mucochytrium quahogii TaxID=96639 RepID=A0A7S2SHE6_9STRA|mmetsp:Transcript_30908/g.49590  ORF Transcript_30908/g.49590 Transcript_30908/m.49590 type:complete len:1123 (+) Transcript_30908:206-3574(+)|eukprot:CAMPEP_0203762626 /NCGR_PEP_ID=MMETSP0098-20131031/15468_1 /ASSEMBLY_ACC=CAM_ASM_000208 /TAXON_ID=96639 /ORGANISM=" , Strain NY0313808BC1" /LENGTH=1122 /DNA_ID=CAMNT_0050657109 /DNA_START=206 /DNA_END=3574 /DNA_ORIENTATION=+
MDVERNKRQLIGTPRSSCSSFNSEFHSGGEYEGVLYKKPTSISAYLSWTGWRSRYCIADNERLKYYGRKGDPTPRGVVEFSDACRIVKKGSLGDSGMYGFDIVQDDSTISFGSNSKKTIDRWSDVLEKKIRQASLHKSSSANRWRTPSSKSVEEKERTAMLVAADTGEEQVEETPESDYDSEASLDRESSNSEDKNSPIYGSAPREFSNLHRLKIGAAVCNRNDGWQLVRVGDGVRIFELQAEFAGNSGTDFYTYVQNKFGTCELKAQARINGPPSHIFAMMMDLSQLRQSWDPTFQEGEIVKTLDPQNDIVSIVFNSWTRFGSPRTVTIKRYWCREANGSYIIYFKPSSVKGISKPKCVECTVGLMYVTITPNFAGRDRGNSCVVTYGIQMEPSGWMQAVKPLAREQVAWLVSSLKYLKELPTGARSSRKSSSSTRNVLDLGTPPLIFQAPLRKALQEAQIDPSDPQSIVPFLREQAESQGELTPQQRQVARAKQLMEREATSVKKRAHLRRLSSDNIKPLLSNEKGSVSADAGKSSASKLEDTDEEPDVDELNFHYAMPKNNYIMPMNISKKGVSAWWDSGVECGYWKVRGPNYLEDRVKIPNETSAMELVQIQWSFYDDPKENIANAPDELVQLQHEGRQDRPFLLVVNFMVPSIGNWVCYFAKRRTVEDEKFDNMFDEFVNGTDEHRTARFKIIPSVVEGSYFVKKGIGSTPALLAKKIVTKYFKGDNWFEVCVDVSSSRVAGSLMSLVKSYASSLVIDLAFLIESQKPEELPERLIGGCRMHLPLMYPVDDLEPYCKSRALLEEAYLISPEIPRKEKKKKSPVVTEQPIVEAQEQQDPTPESLTPEPKDDDHDHEEPPVQPEVLELDYKYEIPENNFLVPMLVAKNGQSAWWDSGTDIGYWKLRGPSYLVDKIKIPSDVSAMELVQVQWSFYDEPKKEIWKDPEELVQLQHAGRKDRPFLLVINFMVPTVGNWVCYFAKRKNVHDEKFDRMLQEFMEGDNTFRNSKFKIIPSVVEGYFIARRAIGSKPAILGKKIDTHYFKGDNCFEICVDVGSSSVAGGLMNVVKSYAASLVIDLAFLLESQTEDELPERLLGGCRMHYPLMYPIPKAELLQNYYK